MSLSATRSSIESFVALVDDPGLPSLDQGLEAIAGDDGAGPGRRGSGR